MDEVYSSYAAYLEKFAVEYGHYKGTLLYGALSKAKGDEYYAWIRLTVRRNDYSSAMSQYTSLLIGGAKNEADSELALCWMRKSVLSGASAHTNPNILNLQLNNDYIITLTALCALKLRDDDWPTRSQQIIRHHEELISTPTINDETVELKHQGMLKIYKKVMPSNDAYDELLREYD